MDATSLPRFAVEAPAYVPLQPEMHDALLAQHPEWMERDGNRPVRHTLQSVDMNVRDYDRRFARLLSLFLTLERANAH